jgi:hypothetical protein
LVPYLEKNLPLGKAEDRKRRRNNIRLSPICQLDPRLGRWFSVDPIFQPWQSPYTSMDNNPICLNDVRGLKVGGSEATFSDGTVIKKPSKGNWFKRAGESMKNFFKESVASIKKSVISTFTFKQKTGAKQGDGTYVDKDGVVHLETIHITKRSWFARLYKAKRAIKDFFLNFTDIEATSVNGSTNPEGTRKLSIWARVNSVSIDDMIAFFEALYKTSAKKGSDGPLYQKPENKLPYGNKAEEKMHERVGDQLKETHDNGKPATNQKVKTNVDVQRQVETINIQLNMDSSSVGSFEVEKTPNNEALGKRPGYRSKYEVEGKILK